MTIPVMPAIGDMWRENMRGDFGGGLYFVCGEDRQFGERWVLYLPVSSGDVRKCPLVDWHFRFTLVRPRVTAKAPVDPRST